MVIKTMDTTEEDSSSSSSSLTSTPSTPRQKVHTTGKSNCYHLPTCHIVRLRDTTEHSSPPDGMRPCLLCKPPAEQPKKTKSKSPTSKVLEEEEVQGQDDNETSFEDDDDDDDSSEKSRSLTKVDDSSSKEKYSEKSLTAIQDESPVSQSELVDKKNKTPSSNILKDYFVTRSGRFYHMEQTCVNLRSARSIVKVNAPKCSLLPCYLCATQELKQEHVNNPRSPAAAGTPTPCFTTRTGECFHVDSTCKGLRNSRQIFRNTSPSKHLRPCQLCVDNDVVAASDKSITPSSSSRRASLAATSSTVKPKSSAFVVTRTGQFFHADYECHNLRSARAKILVQEPPHHLKPCYLCAV